MKKILYRHGPLLIIFLVAFFFRSGGLSHDLDLGNIYHPDTPKQMWAANEFMNERFFHETGNRDFDGYPYFSSLITAKVTSALATTIDTWRDHSGSSSEPFTNTPNLLFRVTRCINAIFSAFAVVVLFIIARGIYGSAVACTAAVFLAFSPVDVAACHYATGDTAAAFFGLLALAFAVRVYNHGRWFDYMLGAFLCVCSFSAKYHGALTVLPLLLAHLFRNPNPKQLFGKTSLIQGMLVVVTAIAAFFVTTAGAIQEPAKTIGQIIGFMQYTSNFHLAKEVIEMGPLGRFIYSMKLNLPVFVDLLGPLLFAFSFVGLLSPIVLRRKKEWLIVSLPLIYIVWGLTSKPASHPVYHALIIPQLILIGSYMLCRLISAKHYTPWLRIAGLLIAACAGGYLLNYASREMFFFKHRDTRVLAQRWVTENVPTGYHVLGSRYSCIQDMRSTDPGPFTGIAWVRCDRREHPAEGDPKLLDIDIDRQSMVFRNFSAEIYLAETDQIKARHAMPLFQWIRSEFETPMILADAKTFYRNTHMIDVKEYAQRTILAEDRLESLLVVVKSLPRSTRVKVKLVNQKQVWHLEENQTSWSMFENLRPNLPRLRERYAYKVDMFSGKDRPAQVCLGITPLEKGVLFYQLGEYQQAVKWLNQAAETENNPTLKAMALISGIRSGSIDPKSLSKGDSPFGTLQTITDSDMAELYGITLNFLNALPYIEISPQDIRYDEFFQPLSEPMLENDIALYTRPSSNEVRIISSDILALDAGNYTVEMKCRTLNNDKSEFTSPSIREGRAQLSDPAQRDGVGGFDTTVSRHPGSVGDVALPKEFLPTIICQLVDSTGATVTSEEIVAGDLSQSEYKTVKIAIEKPRSPSSVRVQITLPPEMEIAIAELIIRPAPLEAVNSLKKMLDATVYDQQ